MQTIRQGSWRHGSHTNRRGRYERICPGLHAREITVTVHSIWKVENLVDRPGRTTVECTVTVIQATAALPVVDMGRRHEQARAKWPFNGRSETRWCAWDLRAVVCAGRGACQQHATQPILGRWGVSMGHSLTLRTSPGRSPLLGLSVSRRFKSVATWFAGITCATAATASSCATAAAQSDLLPSGAVTSTMGIMV
jgi:hypothetical protein